MTEEAAAAPAAAEGGAPAAPDTPAPEATAPVASGAPEHVASLDAGELDALSGDTPSGPMVEIGGHAVSLADLSALPDDVLRQIKRTVKVSGEEREVSIMDAFQAVSLAEGAQGNMREASRLRKEAEAALQRTIADPIGAIRQIAASQGISWEQARTTLEQALVDHYNYEDMDPAARQRADALRDQEAKARAYDEHQRRQEQAKSRAADQRNVETMSTVLDGALASSGVPAEDKAQARARTIDIMRGFIGAEGEVTPERLAAVAAQAAQMAAKELQAHRRSMFATDDDDELLQRVGMEESRRIAKAYARQIPKRAPSTPQPGVAARSRAQKSERVSFDDVLSEAKRKDREGW